MVNVNQSPLIILIVILSMNVFMIIPLYRGFIHFEILCWQNPGHLNYEGELCHQNKPNPRCNPYFIICISDRAIPMGIHKENCTIFYRRTTQVFNNKDYVCNGIYGDNRGDLKNRTKINLLAVSEKYYITIQVYDYDVIASFSNEFSQMPSENLVSLNMEEIPMKRSETNFLNTNASLEISIGIQCGRYLYGKGCLTKCREFKLGNFYCSKDGRKICKPGWKGPNCHITNSCEKLKCAQGATCIIRDNEAKCMCNGRIAPECNQNYIPCSPNPCLHNGECVSHENKFHQCKCVRGYFGDLCEKTVEHWVIIGSIFGLIVILVVIAITLGCIYLTRRAENLQNKDRTRENMDDNQYTTIQDNINRSEYGQRFYADEIERSEKV